MEVEEEEEVKLVVRRHEQESRSSWRRDSDGEDEDGPKNRRQEVSSKILVCSQQYLHLRYCNIVTGNIVTLVYK